MSITFWCRLFGILILYGNVFFLNQFLKSLYLFVYFFSVGMSLWCGDRDYRRQKKNKSKKFLDEEMVLTDGFRRDRMGGGLGGYPCA